MPTQRNGSSKKSGVNNDKELTLAEIERSYPQRWVLVEETAWDKQGNPIRGVVRADSRQRGDLSTTVQEIHKRGHVKTFVFYTGDMVPENITVVL